MLGNKKSIIGDFMSHLPWANRKTLTDEEFFNRTQEISNLTKLLQSTSENNAPDILLTGIRGVGKTVLLDKIKQFMDDRTGHNCCKVNSCQCNSLYTMTM